METALIIAAGAGITAAALLLGTKKKKKPVYTERNVVWWIDKHISPKMLNSTKPRVIDKVYGQYAYLTSPIHNVNLKMDKLMKRTKTSKTRRRLLIQTFLRVHCETVYRQTVPLLRPRKK